MSTEVMLILMLLIVTVIVVWGYYILVRKPERGPKSYTVAEKKELAPQHHNCRCKAIVFERPREEDVKIYLVNEGPKPEVKAHKVETFNLMPTAVEAAQAKRIRRQERNRRHALAGAFRNQS